jgi:hypothetical protein
MFFDFCWWEELHAGSVLDELPHHLNSFWEVLSDYGIS